jgi:tubulin-specific chaperone E
MKVCKVTKQRNANVVLCLIMDDGAQRELNADSDSRELDWLGLEDGSRIVFNIAVQF